MCVLLLLLLLLQVMKEEMELVQEMENVDDRDAELYIDRLQDILEDKARAIGELRDTLHLFQQFRRASVGSMKQRGASTAKHHGNNRAADARHTKGRMK